MNSDVNYYSHLYIPDFKAWENINQRKVSSLAKKEEKRLAIKKPAEVKLQFVSPVDETVDSTKREIRASIENVPRPKNTKSWAQFEGSLRDSKKFSYRT
jgi:hypothetical protein